MGKKWVFSIFLVFLVALLGPGKALSSSGHHSQNDHEETVAKAHSEDPATQAHENWKAKVSGYLSKLKVPAPIVSVWLEFKTKVDHFRNLDEDNEKLRKDKARLEIENAKLSALLIKGCKEKPRAKRITKEAVKEGGLSTSRTLASLKPAHEELLSKPPKVVFKSAIRAFNKKDYESSTKLFVSLAENSENQAFQSAQVYLLTGVSFFRLHNIKKAQYYFQKSFEVAKNNDGGVNDISYAPRAYAWLVLCYQKLGDGAGQKKATLALIHKFPKSKEAQKLNRSRR